MAKAPNQKLKLLYLMEILLENTDENHPMTLQELLDALSARGVSAERKSVYDDLDALRLFGLDIICQKSKQTGYYIGSRDFELPELKLLVDSVQSSKFITHKKTLSLISKIEGLTSVHNARELQRQVFVRNRVKTMNESVYYNVDELSGAIARDRQIRFKYYEYAVTKERRFRKDGAFYEMSPFALLWDDENYYLLAWDEQAERMKHFRVDKMAAISQLEIRRKGKAAFEKMDLSGYTKTVFGMFSGEASRVRLRFASHLAGAVIDRFGKDVTLLPDGEDHFTVSLEVVPSPQFFAWIFGFGEEAELLSPPALRREMAEAAEKIARKYREKEEGR